MSNRFSGPITIVLFSMTFLANVAMSQVSVDSLLNEARYIQDQRSDAGARLGLLLAERSPLVRAAGFRTVAHLGDSNWIPAVRAGLRDKNASVRRMAAFAVGQMGRASMAPELLSMARGEREQAVREELLDAYGRLGSEGDVDSLVDSWARASQASRMPALAGLMRFAIRGVRSPRSIWYAVECLTDRRPEVRWKALYVLGRSAPHPLLATELASRIDRFEACARDASPDVRLNLAVVLGRVESSAARDLLQRLSVAEAQRKNSDWRVRVQVVRSAAAHVRRDGALLSLFLQGLRDTNDHVAIASAMALPTDAPAYRLMELRDSVRKTLWELCKTEDTRAPLVAGEAVVALLRFIPEDLQALLGHWQNRTLSNRFYGKYLEALAQAPSPQGWDVVRGSWDDERASVAMAAWDHTRRFLRGASRVVLAPDDSTESALSGVVFAGLARTLSRGDMGLSTVVSTMLADSVVVGLMDAGGYRDAIADSLAAAVDRMRVPDDVETLQASVQTLSVLGGERALASIERQARSADRSVADAASAALIRMGRTKQSGGEQVAAAPTHTDYDWRLLSVLQATPGVEVVTNRGTVMVQLLPEEAPFTVVSFARLAASGFFDSLTFHRVVPNFVVQGGDPRGDGWGGPGYSVRTESSPDSYERGTVGMASAGRDTEGSQFFITHVATPHLDTRYTIFARVVKGMEIVDRLQAGDRIQTVRVRAMKDQRGARSR